LNTLYLLRHANAEPAGSGGDKERALSEHGLETCQRISNYLQGDEITPDLIICSSALRTRQTLDAISPIWKAMPEVVYDDSIYESYSDIVQTAIGNHTALYKDIMVIGHNPGLQDLALGLSNTPGATAHKDAMGNFAPGCMAKLYCDDEAWIQITPQKFSFLKFYNP